MAGWQALAQGVTDIAGAGLSQWQKNEAAKKAWRQWKVRYTKTVADLKRAGLNPMLALGGGAVGGQPGIGDTIDPPRSTAVQVALESQRTKAEIDNLKANSALARERELTEKAAQDEARERGNLFGAQANEILRRLPGVDDKMLAEIADLRAQAGLNSAREANERSLYGKGRFESGMYEVPYRMLQEFNQWMTNQLSNSARGVQQ